MDNQVNDIDKIKNISLIVTEKCDLSCVYCYENHKSTKKMNFETAKRIIDQELVDLDQYQYYIDFFGGEPFLNFDLIKQIVEYVLGNYSGCYHFSASTNGTQIHGDIQEWLKKYKDVFTLGLSLDGNKTAHDLNRCNSFDRIDLDFFLSTYPNQTVKMTISELSLPHLADSIIYLTEKGFLIACNLAYMVDWLGERNATILVEQLEKLIEYYIDHPEAPRCNLMDFPIEVLAHPTFNEDRVEKYCGCGTNMACYDIQGNKYPCQLFAPISAGDKAKKSEDFIISKILFKNSFPINCRDCYFLRICPFCLGSNYLSTEDIYKPDESRCLLYKLIFRSNAKLKALEWEAGISKSKDEQALLKSICEILDINV